jgi:hypothetical protein
MLTMLGKQTPIETVVAWTGALLCLGATALRGGTTVTVRLPHVA